MNRISAALVVSLGLLAMGPCRAQVINMPAGGPHIPSWSALPDWSSVWERDGDLVWDDRIPVGAPQRAPYNAEYEKLAASLPPAKGGIRGAGGMPGVMTMVFPMEVAITPRETLIIPESGAIRRIYTDGRKHPADPFPSSIGHSIGQWQGRELHVDTCCVKDSIRLPGGGPHSDAMRIKERLFAPDANTLVDEITVEDPKAFTRPWTTVKTWRRRPDWEPVEYNTQENDREFFPGKEAAAPAAEQ
jgi:hypothetical protein